MGSRDPPSVADTFHWTLSGSKTATTLKLDESPKVSSLWPALLSSAPPLADQLSLGRYAADASWICRLMDAGTATFAGTCVDVGRDFKSGDSVVLSITASLRRSAFADPNAAPIPVSTSAGGQKSFHEDLKETKTEKAMRERKAALNTLFSRVNLTPVVDVEAQADGPGRQFMGKREMLDQYEKNGTVGEEEEEKELSQDALAQVCESHPRFCYCANCVLQLG